MGSDTKLDDEKNNARAKLFQCINKNFAIEQHFVELVFSTERRVICVLFESNLVANAYEKGLKCIYTHS